VPEIWAWMRAITEGMSLATRSPIPERKVKDGVGRSKADCVCHLLQAAGHGQPDLCTFAHGDHTNSWFWDLKHKTKGNPLQAIF
jgi:hypothetical protein